MIDHVTGDLSAVSGFKHLTEVNATCSGITSIDPLSQSSGMEVLYLGMTNVREIEAVREMQSLKQLDISDTRVSDLSPIARCQELRTLTRLKELDIANTKVTDLTPLYSLPINKLTVSVGDYVTKDDVRRFEQANPNCDVWMIFR